MSKAPVVKKTAKATVPTSKAAPRPSTKTAVGRDPGKAADKAHGKAAQLTPYDVQAKDKQKIVKVSLFGKPITKHFALLVPTSADKTCGVVHIPSGVRFGVGYDEAAATFMAQSLEALKIDWTPTNLVQGKVSTDPRFAAVAAYLGLINDVVEKHVNTGDVVSLATIKKAWKEVTDALTEPPF